MSKKEEFSALIKIGAEMGGSVKSAFDKATGEATKMGKALDLLYAKQDKVNHAAAQERTLNRTEARLEKLYAQRKKAAAEAAKSSAGKTEAKNLERLTKEIKKAEAASAKQREEFEKNERQLKRMGIDTEHLAKEEDRLGAALRRGEQKAQIGETWSRYGKRALWAAAAVSGAVTTIIGSLFALAKSRTTTAKDLLSFSKGIGMDPVALQNFMQIGERVGVESATVEGFITKLNKAVATGIDPKGGKKMREAFAGIGLDVDYLNKLNPEAKILAIANARQKYHGTQAQWVGNISKLFRGAGPDLVKFIGALGMGGEKISEMKKDGLDSGLYRSEKDLQNSKDLGTQLREFGEQWKALDNIISNEVTPAFTDFFKIVNQELKDHREDIQKFAHEAGTAMREWVESGKAKETLEGIGKAIWYAADGAGWLAKNLGATKTALLAFGGFTFGGSILKGLGFGLGAKIMGMGKAVAPAAGEATAAGAARMGLRGLLWRSFLGNPYFDALLLSGDTKQHPADASKPVRIPKKGEPGRAEWLERIIKAETDRINTLEAERGPARTPAQAAFWNTSHDKSPFGQWLQGLKDQLAQSQKELWMEKNHVTGLFQKPQQPVNTISHLIFNIYAAPGQNEQSIGKQVVSQLYSRLGLQEPALVGGYHHD